MDKEQTREHEELLNGLLRMQEQMEAKLVSEIVEPMLSMQLTTQQLKVLAILTTAENGATVQELAKTVSVSLATMSGIVDRLDAHDMVERVPDPNDLRIRRVFPSTLGRKTMHDLFASRPQLARPPLERLELNDLRALSQGLAALISVDDDLRNDTEERA